MANIKRIYGWRRPHLNPKRLKFEHTHSHLENTVLPTSVDLSVGMIDCYDQGDLGSCTANASAGLAWYLYKRSNLPPITISRLAQYYWSRQLEHSVNSDAGASVADAVKVMHTIGCGEPESMWTYDVTKFKVKPPTSVLKAASKHKINNPSSLDNTNLIQLKTCLAHGLPIIMGFSVYDSFESDEVAKTGIVSMPNVHHENLLGGHCTLLMGFEDSTKMFLMRNSWGKDWAKNGYCLIPYDYITSSDLADDFWTSGGLI